MLYNLIQIYQLHVFNNIFWLSSTYRWIRAINGISTTWEVVFLYPIVWMPNYWFLLITCVQSVMAVIHVIHCTEISSVRLHLLRAYPTPNRNGSRRCQTQRYWPFDLIFLKFIGALSYRVLISRTLLCKCHCECFIFLGASCHWWSENDCTKESPDYA